MNGKYMFALGRRTLPPHYSVLQNKLGSTRNQYGGRTQWYWVISCAASHRRCLCGLAPEATRAVVGALVSAAVGALVSAAVSAVVDVLLAATRTRRDYGRALHLL